jgi:hypothetical protein
VVSSNIKENEIGSAYNMLGDRRNAYKVFIGKARTSCCENNTKIDLEGILWVLLVQY